MGPKDDGSSIDDDAASEGHLSEEAFEAPEDEGALTRFHGHHTSKVCLQGRCACAVLCCACSVLCCAEKDTQCNKAVLHLPCSALLLTPRLLLTPP